VGTRFSITHALCTLEPDSSAIVLVGVAWWGAKPCAVTSKLPVKSAYVPRPTGRAPMVCFCLEEYTEGAWRYEIGN